VKPRIALIAWVLVAILFVFLLLFEISKWRSLTAEVAQAGAERQRLTEAIKEKEEQLVTEMKAGAPVLQGMQWSSEGTDPATFLNRMAELAREKRMTVMGIGPLERQTAAQYTKTWHGVQVQAPYREVRELATRIEQDRGLVENLHLEAAPVRQDLQAPGRRFGADEVVARFRMTALELTPQAKVIIDRTLAAGGDSASTGGPRPTLALQVPTPGPQGNIGRDPFVFATPPPPPPGAPGARPPGAATTPVSEPQLPPLPELKGIVSFPDGFLAILNNQIAKVGDTVGGLRVERITENSVTMSAPGTNSSPRTINLPDLAPAPAPGPRR